MGQDIEIQKASIHFIYPFLPVMDHVALKREDLERLITWCKDDGDGCEGDVGKTTNRLGISVYKVDLGKPENRLGISAYMVLDLDMAYLRIAPLKGKVDNIDVLIEPTLRIFPLGSTCCLTVHASKREPAKGGQENLNLADVHKLLHLVSQKKNSKAEYEIADVASGPNKFSDGKTTLFELFAYIIDTIVEHMNENIEEHQKIRLLGRENVNQRVEEYLCPWVISVLELKGPAHEAFCGAFSDEKNPRAAKREAIRKYERDMAPIVYRSVNGLDFQVEPSYPNALAPDNLAGMYNMNVDARLFAYMSRRSILCITDNQERDPAKYFLPGLIDLCEMVEARANALIILNKVIDEALKNFGSESLGPKERLDRIINLINRFTSALEDPATYLISGDALREIHERLADTSRIDSLTDVVLKKIDMLERLYRYNLERGWAEEL